MKSQNSRIKRILIALLRLYIIILLSAVTLYATSNYYDYANIENMLIIISFFPSLILSIVLLNSSFRNGNITLDTIHWYFILIFFVLVPLQQFFSDRFLYPINENTAIISNLLIFVWSIVYMITHKMVFNSSRNSTAIKAFINYFRIDINKSTNLKLQLLLVISSTIFIILLYIAGIKSFATRSSYESFITSIGGWGPLTLLMRNYLQPLLFAIFIIMLGLLIYKNIRLTWLKISSLIILFMIAAITNNPIMFPRFYAFAILFGIFIIFQKRYNRQNSMIYSIILFLGLPLSTMLDQFRRVTTITGYNLKLSINWEFFFHGHFDAYENLVHTLEYVSINGIVYGKQLIGSFLFFVPRSIWSNKPKGSGELVARYLSNNFDVSNYNVGFPLVAEMYLNFHLIGIIIGAIVYGYIVGNLDKLYIYSTIGNDPMEEDNTFNSFLLLYPFLVGLFLFHLRGDFMSSYSYILGFVLAFVTVVAFLKSKA